MSLFSLIFYFCISGTNKTNVVAISSTLDEKYHPHLDEKYHKCIKPTKMNENGKNGWDVGEVIFNFWSQFCQFERKELPCSKNLLVKKKVG